jgi:hypothetical protein
VVQTVRLDVTAGDIREGIRHSPNLCPTASAFRRAVPKADRVAVHEDHIVFRSDACAGIFVAKLPGPGIAFVRDFDAGGPDSVSPIAFDAEVFIP